MGAGVSVTDKSYFGLRLELSKSSDADRVLWVLDSAASHSLVTPRRRRQAGRAVDRRHRDGVVGLSVDGGFKQVDLGDAALAGSAALGTIKPVVLNFPSRRRARRRGGAARAGRAVALRRRALSAAGAAAGGRLRGRRHPPARSISTAWRACSAGGSRRACWRRPRRSPAGRPPTSPVDAIIDLGSSTTVCNYAVLDAAGIPRDADRVKQTDTVVAGQTGEPIRVAEAPLDLFLGDGGAATMTTPDVSIADLPIFGTLGVRGPAMVLGLDCLAAPKARRNHDARASSCRRATGSSGSRPPRSVAILSGMPHTHVVLSNVMIGPPAGPNSTRPSPRSSRRSRHPRCAPPPTRAAAAVRPARGRRERRRRRRLDGSAGICG